ncbi:conserved hypothetical protein [Shewanella sediminis HAW-EB3]|uniref:Uncharacterized protein n=1 Tax=Shewanella sediminis (strain HAW-EB3) TaxID=425104 RepID=A8FP84_SHESH|nr:DUF1488 family protein [Shewanella sediminis]ABV34657.1 conserved hypothetical protein [Shewanella sediminis HAW-EB3]
MNQNILFPDLQDWDEKTQSVVFPAQVQGANIECRIGLSKLSEMALTLLKSTDSDIKEKALNLFEEYRFDIEEEVETLIELESFDEQGRLVVK